MTLRKPDALDQIVGRNIRFQRIQKDMSQEALGEALGVTFQQIQKYERGVNRVSVGRLARIAEIFQMPIMVFYDGVESPADGRFRTISSILEQTETMQLLETFAAIKNKATQRKIVEFVQHIAAM